MQKNIFTKAFEQMKNIIDYTPPNTPAPFILDESRPYDSAHVQEQPETQIEFDLSHFSATLEFAHHIAAYIKKMLIAADSGSLVSEINTFKIELATLEKQWAKLGPLFFTYEHNQNPNEAAINTSLDANRKLLESIYRIPRNKDVILREIEVGEHQGTPALIVYTDGLIDGQKLNRFVLEPLMGTKRPLYQGDTIEQFIKKVLPNGQIKRVSTFEALQEGVNIGDTALIIDGLDEAIVIETKGWEHRGVDSPKTEQTVRGSLAAFSENLRINTGLIRSMLRSSDLVTEMVKVGTRSKLNCTLMYLDSIANTSLVNEVRRRLEGIETDSINDTSQLIQYIEDSPFILFPQSMSTERPDRVAASLAEGRIVLILEGNPFVHILPVSFFSFFHSAEDFSEKSIIASFVRVLRLFGTLISTILPSLYLSISYFHPEAMPTELLLAVAGSRENVPFPAWFEVLVMEISFELVREAGVRIPGLLASTIGIVGAVILGQAAVSAKLVSPIVVVVVAITGLASFTIPEYRMSSAVRMVRFALFIVVTMWGIVGLAMSFLLLTGLLCRMKSFGMPYMTPVVPRTIASYDVVARGQVFNQEKRPDALNTKDLRRQPTISRTWTEEPPKGDKPE